MRWRVAATFGVWALGSLEGGARAQDFREGVRIDALQPASPESAFFRAEGPHKPADSVEFAVRVGVDEGTDELHQVSVDTAGNGTRVATIVSNALLLRVGASITPWHWLTLEAGAPFGISEKGDKPALFGGGTVVPVAGQGVGDPRVGLHVRPIDKEAFGLLVGGRFWAPVGSKASYLSDGRFRAEVDVAVESEGPKWMWGATTNIAPGFFAARDGDRIALSAALYYKLKPFVALGVEPAFELVRDDVQPPGAGAASLSRVQAIFEPLGAARFKFGFLRFGAAAGTGVGAAGAAGFRLLADVGVVFEGKPPPAGPVKPPDRDLDGIPDSEDACPDAAGPASRDPAKNGCPQLDRDADGIPDEEDFCPDKPGIRHPDPKANGCPDSDNDGVPDPIDPCPQEPGKGDGCPKFAHLQKDGFKIEPPIDFGFGDRLGANARAALEEVAATAHANPKTIDQISIGIGTKGARQALSDKRAQTVLLIMKAQALSSEKYEVVLRDDLPGGKVVVRIVSLEEPPKK